jgi:hypothetical protein
VCDTFEEGSAGRMRADYSIECEGSYYNAGYWYASAMVFIYPIGMPSVYFLMLYKKRKYMNPAYFSDTPMTEEQAIAKVDKNRKLDSQRFLFDMYHPKNWWWEVFETLRRISLTGALMVFKEGSILQLFLGVTICVVSLMMYSNHMPFVSSSTTSPPTT